MANDQLREQQEEAPQEEAKKKEEKVQEQEEEEASIASRVKWNKRRVWSIRRYVYRNGPPTVGHVLSPRILKRMARKHGIQRISSKAQIKIGQFTRITLEVLIHDAKIYAKSAQRRTIHAMDLIAALRKQNLVHYGHGSLVQGTR